MMITAILASVKIIIETHFAASNYGGLELFTAE